jgi:hypothetical protein
MLNIYDMDHIPKNELRQYLPDGVIAEDFYNDNYLIGAMGDVRPKIKPFKRNK